MKTIAFFVCYGILLVILPGSSQLQPFVWAAPPASQPTSQPTSPPTSRATTQPHHSDYKAIQRDIEKGIQLLKHKKYAAFLRRFLTPQDKKHYSKMFSIEAMAPRFGEFKAPTLLAVLQWIQTKQPVWSSQGTRATFSLKGIEVITPRAKILFIKIKGIWYVKD